MDNTLNFAIWAGDVIVAIFPFEMLERAREEFPASIGYQFKRH